jgi:uncharacterized RDD family membrane protein YckC
MNAPSEQRPPVDIRSLHLIAAEDGTLLELELSGVPARVYAFLIDLVVMGMLMFSAFVAVGMVMNRFPEISKTLMYALPFIPLFGYHFLLEWLWHGKTLGKHMLGIRVVRGNGQGIGFWESLGRNLMRLVDVYLSGIGLFSMLASSREKRFGDYLAGTLVVSNRRVDKPFLLPGKAAASEAPSVPETSDTEPYNRLTAEEYELIQSFLARRSRLFGAAAAELEMQLRGHFREKLHLTEEEAQAPEFLTGLCEQYRGHGA